nr:uncharacterized protein LOC129254000 [Lytechinus pictus]
MALKGGLVLLFLLTFSSFLDCSNAEQDFRPDGGYQSTPGLTGARSGNVTTDITSERNERDTQSSSDADSQLSIPGSLDIDWSDYSSSYSPSEVPNADTTWLCPTDSDKCVNSSAYIDECEMNSMKIESMYCTCDYHCEFFDDCCYGYNVTNSTAREPETMDLEKQYWSCTAFSIGVAHNSSCIYNHFVVSRCPPVSEDDNELVQRCENPIANDTVFFDPRKVFYRNRYCALCHGVNSSELTPYFIFVPCLDNLPTEDTFCGQKPYEIDGIVAPLPRSCFDDSTVISHCDSQINNQSSQSLCSNEKERRVFINGSIYRNDDCAKCNGVQLPNDTLKCNDNVPIILPVNAFNVGYYYPVLTCLEGMIPSGTECVPEGMLWPECDNRTIIFAVVAKGSWQCYDGFYGLEVIKSLLTLETPVVSEYDFNFDIDDLNFTTFLEIPVDLFPTSLRQFKSDVEASLEELQEKSCPDKKVIIRERCNVDFGLSRSTTLFHVQDKPQLFEPIEYNGTVYIAYDNTTFITPVLWENDTYLTRFSDEWNFTKEISFSLYGHVVDLQTCASIIVGASLITENTRGNVTILIYQSISFPPDKYTRYKNGSVRLCWTLSDPPEPVSLFSYSRGQYLLNIILFTLSMTCLLATLITYCIFKPLRNLQGISTMNFVFALFVAQVMLQFVSSSVSSIPTACTIAAAITHYFLLAVFTWTNVLAWDLVRHFASSSFLPKRHIETRRMTVYHTIGWCLPLTIIVPCLIVQSQNPSLFRYGKIGSGCWIYQAKGIVLAFLVPVAVSFLINLVFFVLTACGVHKSKRDSRVLHEGTGKRHKEMFTELAVHFKISCLLGFGWTFGFIASFANSATVWTIFILTSSLQGIFVFIFFGANQRVRDLWRKKICGSAAQTRTSTMALTSSTRVGSKTNNNIKTTSSGSTTRV